MKKALVVIIGLAILSGVYLVVKNRDVQGPSHPRGQGERSVPVAVAEIRNDTVRDVRSFTGTLIPRRHVTIAPKIGGRLEQLLFDIGDTISGGSLVAVLDEAEHAQQLEQARAELHVAQANLEEAKTSYAAARRDFDRAQALRDRQVVSEAEMDAAESRYQAARSRQKVAEAQIAQRQAVLRTAEIRLSYTRIEAPPDASSQTFVVAERFVDAGSLLRANDPIVSAIDISSLTAVIHVTERDYPLLRLGQLVTARADAFPGHEFFGEVTRIAPLLREQTRQARVEITLPNTDRILKPGMFVRADITFAQNENATVIPVEALVRREDKTGFFLVKDTEGGLSVEFVPPVLGIVNTRVAEIVEPVLTGRVVTLGHHLLEDGSRITIPAARVQTNNKPPTATPVAGGVQ